jgi:hypothetical protein
MNDTELEALYEKIDNLYGKACVGASTYEAVVQSRFNASMRQEFGDDEQANETAVAAFAHAREIYCYQSAEEENAAQAEDWKSGICSHGLTSMTCPCGCFEF